MALIANARLVPLQPESHHAFDFNENSFAIFLKDVMMPGSPNSFPFSNAGIPRGDAAHLAMSRDVLNFGIDANMELNNMDFGLLDSYNGNLDEEVFLDAVQSQNPDVEVDTETMRKRMASGVEVDTQMRVRATKSLLTSHWTRHSRSRFGDGLPPLETMRLRSSLTFHFPSRIWMHRKPV